jgi:hypothetical protein
MSDRPTVTVASRLDVPVQMNSVPPTPGGNPEFSHRIESSRHHSAIYGWGITEGVDAATFDEWMAARPSMVPFITVATQEQIDSTIEKNQPANAYGYELGLVAPIDPTVPTVPPVNVDVPYIWQEEQRMRCTMGNWENTPTHYDYQWMQDDTLPIGPNNDTLPMLASNDGHSITCVVTAVNAAGATEAPPSNAVLYTAPTEATAALLISGDFNDSEWSAMITQVGNNPSDWRGFDVVVDGINLTLRAQFIGIVTVQDVCNTINAQLGTYLTASTSTAAPWQVLIHSNSTGLASTISYASAPSYLARGSTAGLMNSVMQPRKATTDLSLLMRLRQSVGAITVQGIDASGAARAG